MRSAAWKQLVPLLAFALAVRLAGAVAWQARLPGRFGFPDSQSYWQLGRAIAHGGPYLFGPQSARVFRAPGYPLLLAPIFVFAGDEPSVMWARAQNAVLGTLTVGAAWWLARRLFDARAGLLAAAITGLYPGAVAVSVLVLSEAPFGLLMLAQLGLWTAAWWAESATRAGLTAAGAGLAAGAAALVRPGWLLFTPLAVLLGIACGGGAPGGHVDSPSRGTFRSARARQAWIGTAMLLAMLLAMTPWWIRNARVTGRFVPTTLQVGASLYDGLNPAATGASDMAFVPAFVRQARREWSTSAGRRDGTFEYYLDRRFRARSWAWVRSHPARALELAGIKLWRMWNPGPNHPALAGWPVRLAVLLSYLPVLLLGILGSARTIRRGWPYTWCWLPAVYFTCLHVVFVSSIRYRQPAMLGLIVLAAGVASRWRPGRGPGQAGRSAAGPPGGPDGEPVLP